MITLRGVGFDLNDATVNVGLVAAKTTTSGQDLEGPYLKFTAPTGLSGTKSVTVETADGRTSNAVSLVYQDADVFAPVKFTNVYRALAGAATAVTYCFGYVFVAAGDDGKKGGGFGIY